MSSESDVVACNSKKMIFPRSMIASNNASTNDEVYKSNLTITPSRRSKSNSKLNQNLLPKNIFPPEFTRVFFEKIYKFILECYSYLNMSTYSNGNSLNILENNFITNKQSGLISQVLKNTSASPEPPTTMMTQSTDLATDMIYSLNLHREENQRQETQVHCESNEVVGYRNNACLLDFTYDGILQKRETTKKIAKTIFWHSKKEYRNRNAQKMYALKHSSTRVIIKRIQLQNMKRLFSSTPSHDKENSLVAFVLIPIELATIVLEEQTCYSIEQVFSNTVPLYILFNAFSTISDHICAFSSDISARPEFDGHKQPPIVQRQYFSDVRDTSSQKVLVSLARAQFKTCPSASNQGTATEPEPSQSTSLSTLLATPFKSSFFVRVECLLLTRRLSPFTSSQLNFCLWYDKLPNFNLLPKYTEYDWEELDKWIYIIEGSISVTKYQGIEAITGTRRHLQHNFDDLIEGNSQISTRESGALKRTNYRPCQTRVEMTITTFEEHDEAAIQLQSEPSSPVLSSGKRQEDITGSTDILYEMKFDMRATKSPVTSSSTQDRFKAGLSSGLSSTPKNPLGMYSQANDARGVARSQLPSLATNMHSQLGTSRLQQAQQFSSHSRGNKSTDFPSNHQSERAASETIRLSNVPPNRSISVDTVESVSALPARTRLRRQRRMGSLETTEQPEDPIERLNRLRARISGALSEVKGVLNKYSTETDPGDEVAQKDQKNVAEVPEKDNGPVQFRFIKKVRRRSVFTEDEEDKITVSEKRDSEKVALEPDKITSSIAGEEIPILKHKDTTVKVTEDLSEKISEHEEKVNQDILSEQTTKKPKIKIIVPGVKSSNDKGRDDNTLCKKENSPKSSNNLNQTMKADSQNPKRRISIATVGDMASEQSLKTVKTQRRPSDSAAVLKKISELKTDSNKDTTKMTRGISKNCLQEQRTSVAELKDRENTYQKKPLSKDAQDKPTSLESVKPEKNTDEQKSSRTPGDIQSTKVKPEKRVSTKKTTNLRRSSIAVVENSKTERQVLNNIAPDVKAQRRPSDSAAIIKKNTETNEKNSLSRYKNISKGSAPKEESSIDLNPVVTLIGNESQAPTASSVENNCNVNDIMASSTSNKQAKMMPTNSIEVINDEASITSSTLAGTSLLPPLLATVIGKATTATATATAIATTIETAVTPTSKTDISDDIKDSISPLISDGHESTKVAASISFPQVNETNGQQAQSGLSPNVHRISGISAVSVKKFIPPSTENSVQKNNDIQLELKNITSEAEKVNKPHETVATNDSINQITTKTERVESEQNTYDDTKKPIHQQENISATINKPATLSTESTQLPSQSVQEKSLQALSSASTSLLPSSSLSISTSAQQVAVDVELAPIATGDDICVHDRVPEIFQPTAKKSLSEVDRTASLEISVIPTDSSTGDASTKANATTVATNSGLENIIASTKPTTSTTQNSRTEPKSKSILNSKLKPEVKTQEIMPELQVLPTPVKAVHVHPLTEISHPFGEPKEVFSKKKILLKKIGRKHSTEKPQPLKISNEKDQITPSEELIPEAEAKQELEIPQILPLTESHEEIENSEALQIPDVEEPPALSKPPRKVKKKVIIKRLQRRLSATEQSFFLGDNDEQPLPDVETIEKPIAYVSDDDEDNNEEEKELQEPIKPIKSCIRRREYQIGDLVMYAERYKKTLVRWKRGRVIDRITSISYKIDVDGKEVSAHINYLKKYTGRKVRFGDKEYLEIDYEQIAEEEKKVRTYSIWNLV